jgi:hypothetical protein
VNGHGLDENSKTVPKNMSQEWARFWQKWQNRAQIFPCAITQNFVELRAGFDIFQGYGTGVVQHVLRTR